MILNPIIEALTGRTKVVLCVFGNPYALKFFEFIPWVLEAYEDNDATNLAAANALFEHFAEIHLLYKYL